MDTVTYPTTNVIDFISSRMVPLRVAADALPISKDFRVTWTPTIVVLDHYGTEHQRTIGFLPPEELVPSLILGIGKADFNNGDYNDAILRMNEIINQHPDSAVAPEAVYLRGVCRYKTSHDAAGLKEAYETLSSRYRASEWAKRAHPYSLL